jgi:hypothetical protein
MRSAWTGEAPDHRTELDSGVLFAEIIRICSRIVATDEIHARYMRLFNELRSAPRQSPTAVNVISLYVLAMQSSKVDITRRSSDLPPLSNETGVKAEDQEFARLASLSGATLVTHDGPLLQSLRQIGVRVATPNEALSQLRALRTVV